MKCFYHNDLDGICSAAIVYTKYPECQFFEINYGQPFPWDIIRPQETVYMVDFCLQPFSDMVKLNAISFLIWIDHHKTSVERDDGAIRGVRLVGSAACVLTWGYFCGDKPLPRSVKLLGLYDIWDHSDPDVLPFQYGMRSLGLKPDSVTWGRLFSGPGDTILDIITDGEAILDYTRADYAEYTESYSFPTTLDGIPAIAVNRGRSSSQLFDSEPSKPPLMITFCRLPTHQWTVSLYTVDPDIDVSAIAKRYGGGGHKGAAGFQCERLPFRI